MIKVQGSRIKDQGSRIEDQGSRIKIHLIHFTVHDQGSRIKVKDAVLYDAGSLCLDKSQKHHVNHFFGL